MEYYQLSLLAVAVAQYAISASVIHAHIAGAISFDLSN